MTRCVRRGPALGSAFCIGRPGRRALVQPPARRRSARRVRHAVGAALLSSSSAVHRPVRGRYAKGACRARVVRDRLRGLDQPPTRADLGGGGENEQNRLVHQPRKVIVAADAAGAIPAGLTDRAVQVVRAGLAAAIAVASDQGLPTAGPRVLSCRGNLIVHLVPAPVVARVATLTGWTRADPYRWLAREVAVAGHLAKRGGPVVAPASRADPGPHRSHGLAVSLWDYAPPSEQLRGPRKPARP